MEERKKVFFGSELEIYERVKRFFSKDFMVGPKNAVTKTELFMAIFEQDPRSIDGFSAEHHKKMLGAAICKCRREESPFITLKDGKYFVPENREHLDQYTKRCQKNVENNKNAIQRANDYVDEKKFKNLKK
jgi:hypothetical protein